MSEPADRQPICRITDIKDADARGFVARVDGKQRNVVAARRADEVFVYINLCPHAGHLLDIVPDRFFGPDEPDHLRCGVHGALFRVEDGYCISGPCEGISLRAIPVTIEDGDVFVATE